MTDETMPLSGLMEQSPDADLLSAIIGFSAERQMELEAGGPNGAAQGEERAECLFQRNGYFDRCPTSAPVAFS
ncbi:MULTISPECIES: hypothetical protein [unclassified Methylobacterium]|uniref:hypothetical protein n=1 Tax=Methylobacterium sp. Leaf106 TaxID=1736255 RepID=UPI0003813377|nr:hypothetical protein ASF34_03205 [Methylobacterium sp. Leaf106]